MPRYAALIYGPEETDSSAPPEVWAAIMAEYNDFGATAGAAGVLVGGEALQDTGLGGGVVHLERAHDLGEQRQPLAGRVERNTLDPGDNIAQGAQLARLHAEHFWPRRSAAHGTAGWWCAR